MQFHFRSYFGDCITTMVAPDEVQADMPALTRQRAKEVAYLQRDEAVVRHKQMLAKQADLTAQKAAMQVEALESQVQVMKSRQEAESILRSAMRLWTRSLTTCIQNLP